MSIGSISIPAPSSSHPQASRITASRPASIRLRSCWSKARSIQRTRLVQPSLVAEMEMRELAIGVFEIERDRAVGPTGTAGDLCQTKLKAFREVNANPMLSAGDRVADRLAR